MAYDDGSIRCTEDMIEVRAYHFPAGTKRIRYGEVREARVRDLRWYERGRLWGSSDFRHWFPWDPARPRRTRAIELDLGGWWRPVLTPPDVDALARELATRGVAIRNSPPR